MEFVNLSCCAVLGMDEAVDQSFGVDESGAERGSCLDLGTYTHCKFSR